MIVKNFILYLLVGFLSLVSCSNTEAYKQDLLSDDKTKIINACYEVGEKRDTSSVKNLLYKALDPRITHDLRFKGKSVNHCRLIALQKISNNEYKGKLNQYEVDTIATLFYQDWAVKNEYLKNKNEVDIHYLNK